MPSVTLTSLNKRLIQIATLVDLGGLHVFAAGSSRMTVMCTWHTHSHALASITQFIALSCRDWLLEYSQMIPCGFTLLQDMSLCSGLARNSHVGYGRVVGVIHRYQNTRGWLAWVRPENIIGHRWRKPANLRNACPNLSSGKKVQTYPKFVR